MKDKSFFSLRNTIVFFALFMLLYIAINNKPFGVAQLREITGGHSILDMEMGGYSVDRAYEVLDALGEEGRAFNLKYIVPLDFPFPLAYAMFYFIALTTIMRSLVSWNKPWIIGLIGIASGLMDWLENIMIIKMLKDYPIKLVSVAKYASFFTQAKSICITISTGLIMISLIALLVKRVGIRISGR